jgi:hypothetical protein
MDLASGSACWLMSWATLHAAAAGLRLSEKRRARPGHVSAPDPYPCRGPPRPGTLPRPGPYWGGALSLFEGPIMSSWELRTRSNRGPASLAGPDPSMHLEKYYLSLPRGAPSLAHVVGSGATLRMIWRCGTGAAPSYRRRGTPDSGYRHIA